MLICIETHITCDFPGGGGGGGADPYPPSGSAIEKYSDFQCILSSLPMHEKLPFL